MTTVVRSGFIVRHRFYALVGLLSLRQFPVHWERNENKPAISKAYRMGSILWLAGLELDHRPNPAWLCLLRQPPPCLGHASTRLIPVCTKNAISSDNGSCRCRNWSCMRPSCEL